VRTRSAALGWRSVVAGVGNVAEAAVPGRGDRFWCPCCGTASPVFLSVPNRLRLARHSVCPTCGARSRHRGIAVVIDRVVDPATTHTVLHFAPGPSITAVLARHLPAAEVVTTDLLRTDVDRPGEDVQALTFPDDAYDLVVCNHVLEHVPDDGAAVAELARVTAPGGLAVVSVPGDWSRRETVTFPDTSFNGHHRDYGTEVVDLLGSAFADVEVVVLGDLDVGGPGRVALRRDDRLFLCRP